MDLDSPIWPDGINAASTLVVAIFAVIQVAKLFLDDRSRRAEAHARVSIAAYELRRVLFGWLVEYPHDGYSIDQRVEEVTPAFDDVRRILSELVDLSTGTSQPVRGRITEGYVLLTKAMTAIEEELTLDRDYGASESIEYRAAFKEIAAAAACFAAVLTTDLVSIDHKHSATKRPGPLGPTLI